MFKSILLLTFSFLGICKISAQAKYQINGDVITNSAVGDHATVTNVYNETWNQRPPVDSMVKAINSFNNKNYPIVIVTWNNDLSMESDKFAQKIGDKLKLQGKVVDITGHSVGTINNRYPMDVAYAYGKHNLYVYIFPIGTHQ